MWISRITLLQLPVIAQGSTWYTAAGIEIDDDPTIAIGQESGPYLKNDLGLTAEAFEDYDPQWTVMPRISFSFPNFG
jgi:hypothetical protein